MDAIVANRMNICALPALKIELEIAHPSANFVFSQSGKSFFGLLDDFDAGKCHVLAIGETDAAANIELMAEFCDRKLVFTDSLIIENVG